MGLYSLDPDFRMLKRHEFSLESKKVLHHLPCKVMRRQCRTLTIKTLNPVRLPVDAAHVVGDFLQSTLLYQRVQKLQPLGR